MDTVGNFTAIEKIPCYNLGENKVLDVYTANKTICLGWCIITHIDFALILMIY